MIDLNKIKAMNCNIVLGDLKKLYNHLKKLNKESPIGFFAMDVDIYSSTKSVEFI